VWVEEDSNFWKFADSDPSAGTFSSDTVWRATVRMNATLRSNESKSFMCSFDPKGPFLTLFRSTCSGGSTSGCSRSKGNGGYNPARDDTSSCVSV